MSEHNLIEERLRALEERVGHLERASEHTARMIQVGELSKPVEARIARDKIDTRTTPVGQLKVLFYLRTHDNTSAFEDDFEFEQVLGTASEALAKAIAGLAHPVRIELYKALLTGPKESGALMEIAGLNTTGQLYHHLQAMADVGLAERRGRNLWACQNQPAFAMLLTAGRMLQVWLGEDSGIEATASGDT